MTTKRTKAPGGKQQPAHPLPRMLTTTEETSPAAETDPTTTAAEAPEPTETTTSSTGSSEADASHLDGIDTGEPEVLDGAGEGAPASPVVLSRDDFYGLFRVMFQVPNMLRGVGPLPLNALPIQPHEEEAARQASDAIYDIAEETPALRWLIEPQSKWVQRAIPIAAFAQIKFAAIRTELIARQQAQMAPPAPQPESTPTDAQPLQ